MREMKIKLNEFSLDDLGARDGEDQNPWPVHDADVKEIAKDSIASRSLKSEKFKNGYGYSLIELSKSDKERSGKKYEIGILKKDEGSNNFRIIDNYDIIDIKVIKFVFKTSFPSGVLVLNSMNEKHVYSEIKEIVARIKEIDPDNLMSKPLYLVQFSPTGNNVCIVTPTSLNADGGYLRVRIHKIIVGSQNTDIRNKMTVNVSDLVATVREVIERIFTR